MSSFLMIFSASPYMVSFLLVLFLLVICLGAWLGGKCGKHRNATDMFSVRVVVGSFFYICASPLFVSVLFRTGSYGIACLALVLLLWSPVLGWLHVSLNKKPLSTERL